MKTENRQFVQRSGSALILVVVVTVLLAVVGVMFLMVSRASELETGAVIQSKDLDSAVDSVVAKINDVLVEDLFNGSNFVSNPHDATTDDPWLGDLEPVLWSDNGTPANPADDIYVWPRISDLWGTIQTKTGNLFSQGIWVDPDDDQNPLQWSPGALATYPVSVQNVRAIVITPKDRTEVILEGATGTATIPNPWDDETQTFPYGARADADGDGVADSRWAQVPGLTTSRGEPVFAAIRIIDNCAMLNLNAAHCFYQDSFATGDSPFETPWYTCVDDGTGNYDLQAFHDNLNGSGRYLTEISYLPFLRGHDLNGDFLGGTSAGDNWSNLMLARGLTTVGTVTGFSGTHNVPVSAKASHDIFTNLENPIAGFQFFDISDELELRNRYLVTSKVEARFERADVANFSLDSGGGDYSALEVPRDNTSYTYGSGTLPELHRWKFRVNSKNFDNWSGAFIGVLNGKPTDYSYCYDRRHVCTFYSFDRMFRRGDYPLLKGDFDSLTSGPGWTEQLKEQARKIFWPVGPVTTDIAVPVYVETPAGSGVWKWQNNTNNTETRRRILHLLFAFREYFYDKNGGDLPEAAKSAAQVVANLIDYSDDNSANTGTAMDTQGPFYNPVYGSQANVDCTFITKDIIDDMIAEVGMAYGIVIPPTFGFPAGEIVFGYEKQPFISEVYVRWDASGAGLVEYAVELVNPYNTNIDLRDWILRVGNTQAHQFVLNQIVPAYDTTTSTVGRAVVKSGATMYPGLNYTMATPSLPTIQSEFFNGNSVAIQLLREDPSTPGNYIVIDQVADDKIRETGHEIMGVDGQNAIKREDTDWKYIFAKYALQREVDSNFSLTLGQDNAVSISTPDAFQVGVAGNGLGLCRWHELETLGLYGNGPESSDPNAVQTVSSILADPNTDPAHFNLAGSSSGLLDYIATINRPDLGSLPGRININTAPVHVIAAAIPPTLADPNAADPTKTVKFSALQLAQEIVKHRPYQKLSDLLTKVPEMKQYSSGTWKAENVGMQSIEDDIEEEHWILSNLANKFTVRSDTFTAYILVRLGEEGPQRRMIAIFDRSQVWDKNDRPKLVALHPVPDPR